jgi:hypothetical protein
MAKRSIPAPAERHRTSEEIEEIARSMLDELREISPGKRSLIADEVEADFLAKMRASLKNATKTIELRPTVTPSTTKPVVDFACAAGEPLLQVKPHADFPARLEFAQELLECASLTLSRNIASHEALPWELSGLVAHAVSTAEALLRTDLENATGDAS